MRENRRKMINSENMLGAERRRKILGITEEKGTVKVAEIVSMLGVSGATVRKDLSLLSSQGLLLRTHGGAVIRRGPTAETSVITLPCLQEKNRIALKAKEFIKEGDVIALDAGTTTFQLAKVLKEMQNLTMVTNSLQIGYELSPCQEITVNITGGTADKKFYALSGPLAESSLERVVVNKAFLGASGVDLEKGITDPYMEVAQIKRAIMGASQETILIVDSSKFGKIHFARVCSLNMIKLIITDNKISEDVFLKLQDKGIEVILC